MAQSSLVETQERMTVAMGGFDGSFLEEQLERMRRLNERMSEVHDRVVENSKCIARDRAELHSRDNNVVRDVRRHQTHDYPVPSRRKRKR
jgi:hypothetical protein